MSETNSNDSQSQPKTTATKAIAAGITGTVVAFLTSLITAQADDVVTSGEWTVIALGTVIGAAAAFGVTWQAPANRVK